MQISGLPPVHFVNYSPKKSAGKKISLIKFTFSKSVTNKYEIFITGEVEAVIKLVMVCETNWTDLKLVDQIKNIKALVVIKKSSLGKLNRTTHFRSKRGQQGHTT